MISNFSEASIIVLLWTVRSSMAFENLLVNCWMFIIVLIGVYKDGLHRFFCVFFFTRHQILAKYKLFFYTAWLVRTRWRFIIPHFLYSPSLILFSFWFSFQLSFYSSPPPTAILLPSLTLPLWLSCRSHVASGYHSFTYLPHRRQYAFLPVSCKSSISSAFTTTPSHGLTALTVYFNCFVPAVL